MKGKIALVVGAAAGYVLGTRDGRQRYEQIKTKAEGLWQDPKVQEQVSKVSHAVSSAASEKTDSDTTSTASKEPATAGGSSTTTASATGAGSSSTGAVDG
jgi:hypothetical protein